MEPPIDDLRLHSSRRREVSSSRRTRRYALSFSTAFLPPATPDGGGAEGALARLLAATASQVVNGTPPADQTAIETLERVDPSEVDSPCAICLDEIKNSTGNATRLPRCMHTFHEECILPWLRDCHGTCPVCRTPIVDPPAQPPANPPNLATFSASTRDDLPHAAAATVRHSSSNRSYHHMWHHHRHRDHAHHHRSSRTPLSIPPDLPNLVPLEQRRRDRRAMERLARSRDWERADEMAERERRIDIAAESHAAASSGVWNDAVEDDLLDEALAASGLRAAWEREPRGPPTPATTTRGGGGSSSSGGSSRAWPDVWPTAQVDVAAEQQRLEEMMLEVGRLPMPSFRDYNPY